MLVASFLSRHKHPIVMVIRNEIPEIGELCCLLEYPVVEQSFVWDFSVGRGDTQQLIELFVFI